MSFLHAVAFITLYIIPCLKNNISVSDTELIKPGMKDNCHHLSVPHPNDVIHICLATLPAKTSVTDADLFSQRKMHVISL